MQQHAHLAGDLVHDLNADHPHHFPLHIFGDPEMIAVGREVGLLHILDIDPGIVGRDVAADQTLDVEMLHHVAVARLVGANFHWNRRQLLAHDADSSSSSDLQKLQRIRRRIQQRHRLWIGPMQRPRIHHARSPYSFILPHVRVPVEEIIQLLPLQQFLLQPKQRGESQPAAAIPS